MIIDRAVHAKSLSADDHNKGDPRSHNQYTILVIIWSVTKRTYHDFAKGACPEFAVNFIVGLFVETRGLGEQLFFES